MKYLIILISYSFGLRSLICFLNNGTTEPEEFNTLPNLTIEKEVENKLFFESLSFSDNDAKVCTINQILFLMLPLY